MYLPRDMTVETDICAGLAPAAASVSHWYCQPQEPNIDQCNDDGMYGYTVGYNKLLLYDM